MSVQTITIAPIITRPIDEPMQIADYSIDITGYSHFACPNCGGGIEFDFQARCVCCGQALAWSDIEFADGFDFDVFAD